MPDEALRGGRVGGGEHRGAVPLARSREAVIDVVRRVPPEAGVVVFGVVPRDAIRPVRAPMLEGAEAVGEARVVLARLELGFGKRLVVRDVRARMALGDAEVGREKRHGLGDHGGPAIGMHGELPRDDALADHRGRDQALGQTRRFAMREEPAHYVPAEHVEQDVEIVRGPLGGAPQLGDVPTPQLMRGGGEEFRRRVRPMPELIPPFAHFARGREEPVHRPLGAVIRPFIEQRRRDLARRPIGELRLVQDGQDPVLFARRQGRAGRGRRETCSPRGWRWR